MSVEVTPTRAPRVSESWSHRKTQQAALRTSLERSMGCICAACGDRTGPFEFDHIDPVTKRRPSPKESYRGRLYEIRRLVALDQIQLLCAPCNKSKGRRVVDYRPRGWEKVGREEIRDRGERDRLQVQNRLVIATQRAEQTSLSGGRSWVIGDSSLGGTAQLHVANHIRGEEPF